MRRFLFYKRTTRSEATEKTMKSLPKPPHPEKHHTNNAHWLQFFAPLRALSVSTAYLAPFLLQKGFDLSQIFLLQSVFSLACLLWEIPSGYIADRYGRAMSIKLSAPIAAVAMVGYGLSTSYLQFVICELLLALATGFISGIDTALLLDSLKAEDRESEFIPISQRINALGFASVTVSVPLAIVLVHWVGLGSTLIADGVLMAIGSLYAFRLVEVPRQTISTEAERLSAWHAIWQVMRNKQVRWLTLLGATLSGTTYLAFWLSAPYYTSMGIPVIWFSIILAMRSAWKAWLSHRFRHEKHVERALVSYALLGGLVYAGMATKQLWLVWLVLGHDVIQALQSQPITKQLNLHFSHEYRATMNSLVNLVQRLLYTIAGPLVGLLVDKHGLSVGFLVSGAVCMAIALLALAKLHRLHTFD
jgi:MFS family permease